MITTREHLAASLNELCAALPFETGWYLKDLRGGGQILCDGEVMQENGVWRLP